MHWSLWLVLAFALYIVFRLGQRFGQPRPDEDEASFPGGQSHLVPDAATPRIYVIAARVQYDVAHPSDLLRDSAFQSGVAYLSNAQAYALDALLDYATGTNAEVACMGLEALCSRGQHEAARERLLTAVGNASATEQFFFLRAIVSLAREGQPNVGDVLICLAQTRGIGWIAFPPLIDGVRAFAVERLDAGEQPTLGERVLKLTDEAADELRTTLERLDLKGLQPLYADLDRWNATRIDRDFLNMVGKLWSGSTDVDAEIVQHPNLEEDVRTLQARIAAKRPHSVLLVGPTGVGKRTTARLLLQRLRAEEWDVFEAGSAELNAGMKYLGELEGRLKKLVSQLQSRRIVWYIPEFHQLAWTGRHEYSQFNALDYLLPFVERGELIILGHSVPTAYDRLVRTAPRCKNAMEPHRIRALPSAATLSLAGDWLERQRTVHGQEARLASDQTLKEAWQLAQQYLGDRAAPGSLLGFLNQTLQRLQAGRAETTPTDLVVSTQDLLLTLSKLTGLPKSLIDERETLDLEALRTHFHKHVLGQVEAIDCLVERIAMFKAGVVDPTRPAGVFLFAGPTGTGKTELAKTLTTFLFGSADRMIRLDMSEFDSPASVQRLVGTEGNGNKGDDGSLVEAIRRQPFSVVLLDEFEKADPRVWDFFLQVFDDGRLTDRRGNVADFRQAIIIMTSNVGSTVPSATGLGFSRAGQRFRPEKVREAVDQTFRREFVNRIDRIVIMRPLERDTMRQILRKELDEVFRRRGLRNRAWAVEWEDAALEFLLDRGFTHDLGARPLKRSIERYVLSPLATTIVNHQYPQGDQFLFVKTDGRKLEVQFIDPDAPEADVELEAIETARDAGGAVPLAAMILDARGTPSEVAGLRSVLDELQQVVADSRWTEDKSQSLEQMAEPSFWKSPGRFAVLGHAEYLDRIEAGVRRSTSMLQRIVGPGNRTRQVYPRDLVGRLAQQLFLLQIACNDAKERRPREAFIRIESNHGPGTDRQQADAFALRLTTMYREWARRRGMHAERLAETPAAVSSKEDGYCTLLAVSGYGAWSLLTNEDGLHVYEIPDSTGHGFQRHQVRVRVVAQPAEPPDLAGDAKRLTKLRAQAVAAFAAVQQDALTVVRRYRDMPAPLVRDSVCGWRTGRIEIVLQGNFDLMPGLHHPDRDRPATRLADSPGCVPSRAKVKDSNDSSRPRAVEDDNPTDETTA